MPVNTVIIPKRYFPVSAKRQPKFQLNSEVPLKVIKTLRSDARKLNKPIESMVVAMFDYFYTMKIVDREKYLSRYPNKTMGRKVK